jgi:hypothetical protein
MTDIALLAVPLCGLVFLALVGAGVTVGLAGRLPAAAQAALAPVTGAALVAVASVLLPLGLPARALAAAVAALGLTVTVLCRRRVTRAVRASAWPALVAAVAILLAGLPGLARSNWQAATMYGSTDAYHWASQARAYLDGPAASPIAEHPDRLTYERSRGQHWAVALPFGLLQVAWATDSDPPEVYGAFAALVFSLLPLTAFALALAVLAWRVRLAAAAGLALACNASLLFASHFSWQQQLAGTALALAAAALLRMALEPDAGHGEALLAALLAAAALATYRMGFAPYLAALLVSVVVAYGVARRSSPADLRTAGRTVALFLASALLLGSPSLVALARGLPDFVSSGGFSTAFKRAFPAGQPAEALGLVPRVWSLEEGWPAVARLTWLAVASALGALLLVLGARALRRAPAIRADFLAAGVTLVLIGFAVLRLPSFTTYLSFKLLAYGAPFLVLLALTPLALTRGRTQLVAAGAAATLLVASAGVATLTASGASSTSTSLSAVPVAELPPNAVVEVTVDDPWEQAWALYYLRDRRVSVERPSFLLTGQGQSRAANTYRRRPVDYVLGPGSAQPVVWRGDGLALTRVTRGVRVSATSR